MNNHPLHRIFSGMSSAHTTGVSSLWNHSVLQQCLSVLLVGTFFCANSIVADEATQEQIVGKNEQAADLSDVEMEALGQSLKAAVISGQMDKAEAKALWEAALTEIKSDEEDDKEEDDEASQGKENPKSYIGGLIPPNPTRPVRLLEPEFLTRDVQFLVSRLELDQERARIIKIIIQDYTSAFEAISTPLTDAIERYQQMQSNRELEDQIAQLDRATIFNDQDMDQAIETMSDRVREYALASVNKEGDGRGVNAQGRAEIVQKRASEWTQGLTEGLKNLNDQMSSLRARMQARLEKVPVAGEQVTAKELVQMGTQLREQRAALKVDVFEMLQVLVVLNDIETEQAALNDALAELDLRHNLRHARMGGEFINPWSILIDAFPSSPIDPLAEAALEERKPFLASAIQERERQAIAREIAGLQLLADRDLLIAQYGDEDNAGMDRWLEIVAPFAKAWNRQIEASINYRNQLLSLVDYTTNIVAEQDASIAHRYHQIAMQQGFAPEMRTRWCERALQTAMKLDDLNQVAILLLRDLSNSTSSEIKMIREQAISKRMKRDPELARQPVLSLWGLDPKADKPWITEDWTGQEYDAHTKLNERTETTLRSILTPAQFNMLPYRQGSKDQDKGKLGENKGKQRNGSDKGRDKEAGNGK